MSDFLKCLLEVIRKNDVVSFSLHFIDALVFLFNETVELLWRNAILTPSVICCLDFHRTQRDDVRTGENPDILAFDCRVKPFAEVFLGVSNRKSRHKDY